MLFETTTLGVDYCTHDKNTAEYTCNNHTYREGARLLVSNKNGSRKQRDKVNNLDHRVKSRTCCILERITNSVAYYCCMMSI